MLFLVAFSLFLLRVSRAPCLACLAGLVPVWWSGAWLSCWASFLLSGLFLFRSGGGSGSCVQACRATPKRGGACHAARLRLEACGFFSFVFFFRFSSIGQDTSRVLQSGLTGTPDVVEVFGSCSTCFSRLYEFLAVTFTCSSRLKYGIAGAFIPFVYSSEDHCRKAHVPGSVSLKEIARVMCLESQVGQPALRQHFLTHGQLVGPWGPKKVTGIGFIVLCAKSAHSTIPLPTLNWFEQGFFSQLLQHSRSDGNLH